MNPIKEQELRFNTLMQARERQLALAQANECRLQAEVAVLMEKLRLAEEKIAELEKAAGNPPSTATVTKLPAQA